MSKDARAYVLRTYLMIVLLHGKGGGEPLDLFDDRNFLISQITILADLIESGTPYLRNLAFETCATLT